jgi:transposase-like protein
MNPLRTAGSDIPSFLEQDVDHIRRYPPEQRARAVKMVLDHPPAVN